MTGVVTDGRGRTLLVEGPRGWEPPGGQVELGEDLVTALGREVREESGCEVEVGALVGVHSHLGRPGEGVPEQVVLTFSCRWTAGEPRGGHECTNAGWFSPEDALRLVEAPNQREKLEDVLVGDGPDRGAPAGDAGPRELRYRAYKTLPYEALLDKRC